MNAAAYLRLVAFGVGLLPLDWTHTTLAGHSTTSNIRHVWANNGEDKVTQDDLRAQRGAVANSVWDGTSVLLFGGRNETVAFNLVLEADKQAASNVTVTFDRLAGPNGATISSTTNEDLFDFRGRNIELFFVRYLKIEGISRLAYADYDERHVPKRFRRPTVDRRGRATGGWKDRPDHDKQYPDIAVPLELHRAFDIADGTNQSIWCDIFVPKGTPPGVYRGEAVIAEDNKITHRVPIQLVVRDFTLPDLPTARTMLFVGTSDVNGRYLGEQWPHDYPDNLELNAKSRKILDNHFKAAHRHRISLIDDFTPIERLQSSGWTDRLSGKLFTNARGYAGPGEGVGNNVYCIGCYGSWQDYFPTESQLRTASDKWVNWFDAQQFKTPTEYFLFLLDESSDYDFIESRAQWLKRNSGVGRRLKSFATIAAPEAVAKTPSLSIVCSTSTVNEKEPWSHAVQTLNADAQRQFWMYNGFRPASGCLATEDDGVALRQLAWGQFKFDVERWFVWESAVYARAGLAPTNVFQDAATFGYPAKERDPSRGRTGYQYNNGDGVLFYPGTDRAYPNESYGIDGPIVSLRLKHWRRGLQDFEYLTMAKERDAAAVDALVKKMCPKIFWENGVENPADPTYVHCDISWPTDPDVWEDARKTLADIIDAPAITEQK